MKVQIQCFLGNHPMSLQRHFNVIWKSHIIALSDIFMKNPVGGCNIGGHTMF